MNKNKPTLGYLIGWFKVGPGCKSRSYGEAKEDAIKELKNQGHPERGTEDQGSGPKEA